jgi:hypothetical protein
MAAWTKRLTLHHIATGSSSLVCGQTRSNKLLFQPPVCGAASRWGLGGHMTTLAFNLQCRTSLAAAAHLAACAVAGHYSFF